MSRVLIVEDERSIRQGLCEVVSSMGLAAAAAAGLGEARQILGKQTVDCVLLDIRLRDGDGLDLLTQLRAGPHRDVPVIVATAYGDSERTIRAMRDGAFDYLTKPFDLPTLRAAVGRALKQRALSLSVGAALPPPSGPAGNLVGTSAAMLAVWKLIGRAAASTAPVLITGETGTGKELVARAIHSYSVRSAEPFVAVNLAALAQTVIESELFGHERGSFTGATGRHEGRIESAGAGTLFLDEIGDLDPSLQTKLLRFAQEGTFERVGGNEVLRGQARIIAATNRPVRPGVSNAALREDLYYRLAVIEIDVPPLRARRSDIPQLVAHALQGTRARAVSEEAMSRLEAYAWPGNVRELFHVLERAAVLCGGEVIDMPNLPDLEQGSAASPSPIEDVDDLSLHRAVADLERQLIVKALGRAQGNRSAAARLLGIGRALLYSKLEEYAIAAQGGDDSADEK